MLGRKWERDWERERRNYLRVGRHRRPLSKELLKLRSIGWVGDFKMRGMCRNIPIWRNCFRWLVWSGEERWQSEEGGYFFLFLQVAWRLGKFSTDKVCSEHHLQSSTWQLSNPTRFLCVLPHMGNGLFHSNFLGDMEPRLKWVIVLCRKVGPKFNPDFPGTWLSLTKTNFRDVINSAGR